MTDQEVLLSEFEKIALGIMYSGNVHIAMFASSTEDAKKQTDGFITDYHEELQRCGQADADFGANVLVPAPYSIRLRPVCGVLSVRGCISVVLESIDWRVYDTKYKEGATYGDGQNSTVVDAIEASVGSLNNAYVQSRFRNGQMPDYQNNYFRPQVRINSTDILPSLLHSELSEENPGDMSIGLPFDYAIDNMRMRIGAVDTIECWAGAAQRIEPAILQRYAIVLILRFRGFGRRKIK